jgi:hypothetical protein
VGPTRNTLDRGRRGLGVTLLAPRPVGRGALAAGFGVALVVPLVLAALLQPTGGSRCSSSTPSRP